MIDCAIIIMGATGDLTRKKLLGSLYRLYASNKLRNFFMIGAALHKADAQNIVEQAAAFIPHRDEKKWHAFKERFYYQQLDINKQEDFVELKKMVEQLEKKYKTTGNRLLYCATAAYFFCPITTQAADAGLLKRKTKKSKSWHRIVYEKPFGHNLKSAQDINACIKKSFDESQIYRIDHYLTKELVSNIALIRFTNCVFEPLWNHRFIDQIQIIVSETEGVEGRAGYYDTYGALSDVMQNHMLEMLALVAMETPEKLTGEYIRDERAKVLKHIEVVDSIMGQYKEYRKEKNVEPDSITETFAIAQLRINNRRWAGVPIYLKTGKRLDKKETVIHIKFKQVDCLLAQFCPSDSNYLTIQVAPEASFTLSLNAKKPGELNQVIPVKMEFCHSCLFGQHTPEAYEILLEEIMRGEQSVAVRFDEIEYAWKVIDTIKKSIKNVYIYESGTVGPKEADLFAKKHGMRWRS